MRPLRTARLDLVPLDPDRDAESLHAMLADPATYEFDVDEGPTRDVAETRERLHQVLTGNGGWTWALRLRPYDAAIGTIGLFFDQGTPIRGLSWSMRPDHWGRGLMGEAAPVVVDHLLAQPGIDGVEAWIDSRNTRSLGVARRARLDEAGRLPRGYADHTAQNVVMVRAAVPRDPDVLGVRAVLPVREVPATAALLVEILGLHQVFTLGEPPRFVQLALTRWSGAPGLEVVRADGTLSPTRISVEVGSPADHAHARAVRAGLRVVTPLTDQPWYRRDFTFELPDGHQVSVAGPLRPSGTEGGAD
ncbi:GNAT family N-acetyltransferase [Actinopolymorpha pittospori]